MIRNGWREVMKVEVAALRSAELYWVARNMVEAAVGASSTLPDLLCDWSGEASVIVRCVIRH
jgi:hypothetical protein